MSESEHRQRLHDLMRRETTRPDLQTFLEGLAASNVPLAEQLGRVLDLDDKGRVMPGPYVIATLKIHELAPAMIRQFSKTDEYFQDLLVQLIGHLDHEDVVPFFLSLFQTKHDSHFHFTVLGALRRYPWQPEMQEPLSQLVRNTTEWTPTRQQAIGIIASQPDTALAWPILLPLLQDSNSEIRLHALIHLKDVGNPSLVSHIEPLLKDMTISKDSSLPIARMAQYVLDTWARKST